MDLKEQIFLTRQADNCLLCGSPSCEKACVRHLAISETLRSIRFDNVRTVLKKQTAAACAQCPKPACEEGCCLKDTGIQVKIKEVMGILQKMDPPETKENKKASLETVLCGVPCENPFFLSSSVVGSNYEMTARAFEMGWAGAAFKTIGMFTPEEVSPRFANLARGGQGFVGFKNIEQISDHPLGENLDFLRRLKKDYPQKVLIASIMGRNEEEWRTLASLMEEAGADLIECNFSCPNMTKEGLGSDVGTDPGLVEQYTRAAKSGTGLPVLAKMTPNITSMEPAARAAVRGGADGLAAINTIKSVMNVSLENFISEPDVHGKSAEGGYSGKAVKPIALRFIRDLMSDPELKKVPVSGMGGIETWRDAGEFIALGCSTVQITTAVMEYGYRIIQDLKSGLEEYLSSSGLWRIGALIGKALPGIVGTEDLDRDTICYPVFDKTHCVGCGRCCISCMDGGHQALVMKEDGQPALIREKCVGCHLCVNVCPMKSISSGPRVPKK